MQHARADSVFRDAFVTGAGLNNARASSFERCAFTDNGSPNARGTGMYVGNSVAAITNGSFSNNGRFDIEVESFGTLYVDIAAGLDVDADEGSMVKPLADAPGATLPRPDSAAFAALRAARLKYLGNCIGDLW